jgi:hypothetical protein
VCAPLPSGTSNAPRNAVKETAAQLQQLIKEYHRWFEDNKPESQSFDDEKPVEEPALLVGQDPKVEAFQRSWGTFWSATCAERKAAMHHFEVSTAGSPAADAALNQWAARRTERSDLADPLVTAAGALKKAADQTRCRVEEYCIFARQAVAQRLEKMAKQIEIPYPSDIEVSRLCGICSGFFVLGFLQFCLRLLWSRSL